MQVSFVFSLDLKDLSISSFSKYSFDSYLVKCTYGPVRIISLKFLGISGVYQSCIAQSSERINSLNQSIFTAINLHSEYHTLMMQVASISLC